MMKVDKILIICTGVMLFLPAISSSRSLYSDKTVDSGIFLSTPQIIIAPDSIVDPVINWPVYAALQQTAELSASFDCFGMFGTGGGNGHYLTA